MSSLELQQLRRVAGAVARLRGEGVREVTVRSDLRQLKMELESGLILVVSAGRDGQGRPQLEVDVVELALDATVRQQLEVRFEEGSGNRVHVDTGRASEVRGLRVRAPGERAVPRQGRPHLG